VRLHVSAAAANLVFELTRGGVEGVAYDDTHVFVLGILPVVVGDCDLPGWRRDVEVHHEHPPGAAMTMGNVDHDVTADDSMMKTFESLCALANHRLDRFRRFHASKRDL
jgi:hypothetical protein